MTVRTPKRRSQKPTRKPHGLQIRKQGFKSLEMLPVIYGFLRAHAPYITLPVAAVIGFIGYKIESYVSDKYTPYHESIKGKREQRLLEENLSEEVTQVDSLKEMKFVPQSVLERNLSPSLLEANEAK